jgi:hypothetical protein
MTRQFIIFLLTFILFGSTYSQDTIGKRINKQALFVQAEYQFINYDFITIGLGFQPQKFFLTTTRKHPKLSFSGYTLNFNKSIKNADWGVSGQLIHYSASSSGPIGFGLELNYKNIQNQDHFGFKPLIGLSFSIVSIMYAYNFDLYNIKSDRLRQNELILGFRIPILRRK